MAAAVSFQPVTSVENERLTDLNVREMVIMAALVIPILWIGIYPKPILDRMERSAAQFISDVERGAAERTAASRMGN